jgi:hypothetical protein
MCSYAWEMKRRLDDSDVIALTDALLSETYESWVQREAHH